MPDTTTFPPARRQRSPSFTFTIDADDLERLDALASRHEIAMADIARYAIREALERYDAEDEAS